MTYFENITLFYVLFQKYSHDHPQLTKIIAKYEMYFEIHFSRKLPTVVLIFHIP